MRVLTSSLRRPATNTAPIRALSVVAVRATLLLCSSVFAAIMLAPTAQAQVSDGSPGNDSGWLEISDILGPDALGTGSTDDATQQRRRVDPSFTDDATQQRRRVDPSFIPKPVHRLRSADKFLVTVVGHKPLSRVYTVDANGESEFDLLGPLIVRGLSLTDLATNLERLYNRRYLQNARIMIDHVVDPVSISIVDNQNPKTSVAVPPQSSVLEALSQSGRRDTLAPSDVIIVKSNIGQTKSVIQNATLGENGYMGPQIARDETLIIGDWYVIITKNRALNQTPYLKALIDYTQSNPAPDVSGQR